MNGDGDGVPDSRVLSLAGVARSFRTPAGPVPVLTAVDLEVAAGEIVVITGRSGSGKTTLITIVSGWDEPQHGTVRRPQSSAGEVTWSDISVVPQALGLLDELTIAENVTLPLRLRDGDRRAVLRRSPIDRTAVFAVLEGLRIDHLADRFPTEASLGEQQRTAVARALVTAPRLLVADEPIAHQNSDLATAVMSRLRELADAGTACLVATHNEAAFAVADRILALKPAGTDGAGRRGQLVTAR